MNYILKYGSVVLSFLFVGLIKSSPLESQISFILAVLIVMAIIYTTIQRRKNRSYNMLFSGKTGEIFFISTIVLLMIEITGGIDSPVYFLNYFLLFGLPLISTPLTSLIFTGSIMLFYIPDLIRSFNTDILLRIGSILLLLPLSYFLSNELMKRQRENITLKQKAKEIEKNAQALEADEDDIDAREKLDDIIESAEDLEEKS
jgi:hypothetical protein